MESTPMKENRGMTGSIDRGFRRFVDAKVPAVAIVSLVAVVGFLLECTGAWWLAIVAGVLGGLKNKKAIHGLACGFTGTLIAWGMHLAIIAWFRPLDDLNILFSLVNLNAGWVVVATVVLGGLLGGLGGLNGAIVMQGVKQTRWFTRAS